ncbi:hypothetical protein [Oceanobacillus alkalisoli]|uniref:hypothetical protein n=1 Tax=Oceanobacillus alkalisoli TaxID=2925113 RepID=UPI001EE3B271|nr:hypothetical protein [Oceanobacillus alkalisoli]MCG5104417.1 hypothetical protein [Oceanobacillus alkalisoli]
MKVTVGDVTNNKVNVRDYMGVDEETGRIFVDGLKLDTVLIDKSEEWDELKRQNERYRDLLNRLCDTDDIVEVYDIVDEYKALEGDSE